MIILRNRQAYQDGTWNPDTALAQQWRDLDDENKARYQRTYEAMKNAEKEGAGNGAEDVEMGDGEEEREDEAAGGGFTAVNRG